VTPSWRLYEPDRRIEAQAHALERCEGEIELRGWRCRVCALAQASPWAPDHCALCGAGGLLEEASATWGGVLAASAAAREWRRRPPPAAGEEKTA